MTTWIQCTLTSVHNHFGWLWHRNCVLTKLSRLIFSFWQLKKKRKKSASLVEIFTCHSCHKWAALVFPTTPSVLCFLLHVWPSDKQPVCVKCSELSVWTDAACEVNTVARQHWFPTLPADEVTSLKPTWRSIVILSDRPFYLINDHSRTFCCSMFQGKNFDLISTSRPSSLKIIWQTWRTTFSGFTLFYEFQIVCVCVCVYRVCVSGLPSALHILPTTILWVNLHLLQYSCTVLTYRLEYFFCSTFTSLHSLQILHLRKRSTFFIESILQSGFRNHKNYRFYFHQ